MVSLLNIRMILEHHYGKSNLRARGIRVKNIELRKPREIAGNRLPLGNLRSSYGSPLQQICEVDSKCKRQKIRHHYPLQTAAEGKNTDRHVSVLSDSSILPVMKSNMHRMLSRFCMSHRRVPVRELEDYC